jgi:ABC-type uncharacterized transport system permease subunit
VLVVDFLRDKLLAPFEALFSTLPFALTIASVTFLAFLMVMLLITVTVFVSALLAYPLTITLCVLVAAFIGELHSGFGSRYSTQTSTVKIEDHEALITQFANDLRRNQNF